MKKIIFALAILLVSNIVVSSQVSFYGVSIGDSKYSVKSSLENQNVKFTEETTKSGNKVFRINKPSIAGIKFDIGSLVFENGYLSSGTFVFMADGGVGNPGMPWESEFLNRAQRLAGYYEMLYQKLYGKYGTPVIDTDNYVEWQKGNTKICLTFDFKYEQDAYGWIDHFVYLDLKYEKNIDTNDY